MKKEPCIFLTIIHSFDGKQIQLFEHEHFLIIQDNELDVNKVLYQIMQVIF